MSCLLPYLKPCGSSILLSRAKITTVSFLFLCVIHFQLAQEMKSLVALLSSVSVNTLAASVQEAKGLVTQSIMCS